MAEEFRTITGLNKYEISNFGVVRNKETKKIKNIRVNRDGYYILNLNTDDCKKVTKKIHRLVAETFLENPDNKPFVDHIDNNPLNNNVNNLRFATCSENCMNKKIPKNNKRIHLGCFKNIDDAIKTRQDKAKELFGEYMNQCEKQDEKIEFHINMDLSVLKHKPIVIIKFNINDDIKL